MTAPPRNCAASPPGTAQVRPWAGADLATALDRAEGRCLSYCVFTGTLARSVLRLLRRGSASSGCGASGGSWGAGSSSPKARAAHSAALAATPPPPSPVSSPVAAPPANKKGPPRDTDGLLAAAPRVNPMHTTSVDVEAPAPPPAVVLKLREPPAATASAPALLGLFEHALDEARARNAPPPRLAALLRGSPGLVFLKGDL